MMVQEAWKRFLDAQSWEHLEDDQEFLVANGRVDLKKFMAISDFEDETLAKVEKAERAAREQSLFFTEKALQAMNTLRERREALHRELVLHLRQQGIPGRVVKSFWALEGFIIDFVEDHRQAFGLPPILAPG